jgi:hypothetical protein
MGDKPILFSAPMIRALLDGRKTQTRRVLKHPKGIDINIAPTVQTDDATWIAFDHPKGGPLTCIKWPYAPGDRLWVKEAWNCFAFSQDGEEASPTQTIPSAAEYRECKEDAYRFDIQAIYRESDRARKWFSDQQWRSPIHMPRWASRLTLTVTDVRVQRLQDISEADAMAEGANPSDLRMYPELGTSCDWFHDLWNSLHGPDAWDANPWVVALTFDVHHRNIDQMPGTSYG